MKKIKLIPIDDEFNRDEDLDAGEDLRAEGGLLPCLAACAAACGMLLVTRLVQKRLFKR